jgi:hypothetical protein
MTALLESQDRSLADQRGVSREMHAISGLFYMEIDRVRFVLASYLRVRLSKVRVGRTNCCSLDAPARRSASSCFGS